VNKHRTHRDWTPLIAGLVVLTVTSGVVVGLATATGSPSSPSVASAIAAKVRGSVDAAMPTTGVTPTSATPVISLPVDSRRAAYLTALKKADISTVDEPTVLLIASGVCAQHQTSEAELIRQVLTLFPKRWTAEDAHTLVDCAKMFFCG
jgi:hypothetical protein